MAKAPLVWEEVDPGIHRARVFGGWLVTQISDNETETDNFQTSSITFVPDSSMRWVIEKGGADERNDSVQVPEED